MNSALARRAAVGFIIMYCLLFVFGCAASRHLPGAAAARTAVEQAATLTVCGATGPLRLFLNAGLGVALCCGIGLALKARRTSLLKDRIRRVVTLITDRLRREGRFDF